MKKLTILCLAVALYAMPASAAVEPNYDPGKPPVTTPWYAAQTAAQRQADLDFIKGMRPHHAGALTMSRDYLASAQAGDISLKKLAKGIIHNQTFEIGMLDRVEELVAKPIYNGIPRQIAEQGLAQKQRFVRAPMPGPFFKGAAPVTADDVRFAKAMIVHHQGALDMARAYLGDAEANNKYLRLLCLDILLDQKQEIDFLNRVIARYPGNPDEVKIDPSMIHGMEGMHHAGHVDKPAKGGKQGKKRASAPASEGNGQGKAHVHDDMHH